MNTKSFKVLFRDWVANKLIVMKHQTNNLVPNISGASPIRRMAKYDVTTKKKRKKQQNFTRGKGTCSTRYYT